MGLGLWQGSYEEVTGQWLRFYDGMGNWIPTPEERVEQELLAKEQERQRAILAEDDRDRERLAKEQERRVKEQERIRADNAEVTIQQLRDRLLQLGVDPNSSNSSGEQRVVNQFWQHSSSWQNILSLNIR